MSNEDINELIRYANQFEYLTEEQEQHLLNVYRQDGDQGARERLLKSHLRLVAKAAINNRGYGISVWDLFHEGCQGLLKAIDKFSPDFNNRLSTYAYWWIISSIYEYILANWHIVSVTRDATAKKLLFKLSQIRNSLGLGHKEQLDDIDIDQISEATGIGRGYIREFYFRQRHGNVVSTQTAISEDGDIKVEDSLGDDTNVEDDVLSHLDHVERNRIIERIMRHRLKPREHDIIVKRYLTDPPRTLDEITEIYPVSRERIRQIESRALKKLKKGISEEASDLETAITR